MIMVHVKGHSGDIGNDYADTFVQDGKGSGPFSRIQLSRGETMAEKCARHRTLSAMALPFELATGAWHHAIRMRRQAGRLEIC